MSPGIWGAHELRDWQGFLNVLTLKQGGPDGSPCQVSSDHTVVCLKRKGVEPFPHLVSQPEGMSRHLKGPPVFLMKEHRVE